MAITTNTVNDYQGLGRALRITDGKVELLVTLDVGPRVIHCSLAGGENLFWVNKNHIMEVPGLDEAFHKGATYAPMGGHRLWSSPEHPLHSYFPDTDPVAVEALPNGVTLTPPPRPITGEQHRMQVTIDENSEITVTCSITNAGSGDLTLAPWCVTQMASGGVEIIPHSKRETGLLPDRRLSVWPYTDMGDPRLCWGDDYVTLAPDCAVSRALKIGMHNRDAWALYLTGHTAFLKRFDVADDGVYPDGGVSYETYCNEHFMEMESLGQLVTLAPGQTASHTERWTLTKCARKPDHRDMAAVADAVAALL